MNGTSNGRVVRIAIAASLALHLVFAAVVHPKPVRAQSQQEPKPLQIVRLIPPPPSPTPPPKPQHHTRVQQQPTRTVRPPVAPPKLPPVRNSNGRVAVVPRAEPTGNPQLPETGTRGPGARPSGEPQTPAPTPKPACSAPDVPARTIAANSPDEPEDARDQGITGTTKVRVDLDASGNVLDVSLFESSGSMLLDRAALDAARASSYAPGEHDCKNIPGSYLFTVNFE